MPFSQAEELLLSDKAFCDSPLLSVRPAQLYALLANRNAWHSTTSRVYNGPKGLYGSLDGAQQAAEGLRKPGTWFNILEVPGLAIRGESGLVVATEHHSRSPYGRWRNPRKMSPLRIGTPLGQALSSLGPGARWARDISRDSFISGVIRDPFVEDLTSEAFRLWESSPQGPRYYLDWRPSPHHLQRHGVDRICAHFHEVNSDADIALAGSRYFEARDKEWTSRLGSPLLYPRPRWAPSL